MTLQLMKENQEKEDKIDIESLTDEEWAKYLGL